MQDALFFHRNNNLIIHHHFTMQLVRITALLIFLLTPALAKKNILFIAGAPSHANGEHEFRAGCMLLAKALNESGLDIAAKVHHYGWPKDESIFNNVDACIIYADAGGQFGEKYEFLDQKVKAGMSIMFMHYGVHPSKEIGKKYGFESICYGHAGDGNLHVNIIKGDLTQEQWDNELPLAIREIFQLTVSLGGTISGEHGIGWVQKDYMDIAYQDIELNLMREIKKVFDPKNIMNPSKIF